MPIIKWPIGDKVNHFSNESESTMIIATDRKGRLKQIPEPKWVF
jgi:hypothetical protein